LTGKKSAHVEAATVDSKQTAFIDEENQGPMDEESSDESSVELTTIHEPSADIDSGLLPEGAERRATFTFTMDADTVEDLPDYESLDGLQDDSNDDQGVTERSCIEDTTMARLFRSPTKAPLPLSRTSPEPVEYPELPHSDEEVLQSDTIIEQDGSEQFLVTEQADDVRIAEEDEMGAEEAFERVDIDAEKLPEEAVYDGADSIDIATESAQDHDLSSPGCTNATHVTSPAITTHAALYPALLMESSPTECDQVSIQSSPQNDVEVADNDVDMSEFTINTHTDQDQGEINVKEEDAIFLEPEHDFSEENFTEASLQLNIQKDYEEVLRGKDSAPSETSGEKTTGTEHAIAEANTSQQPQVNLPLELRRDSPPVEQTIETHSDDITDGLTLSFTPAKPRSVEPTPRKLHSPPPPPIETGLDDVTMTIALDDDTALLKEFLNRAAASKAEKAAVLTHRRESLQNRRDSDVIRHALASPRIVLEEKDPNSPSKYDNELTLDLSQTLTLSMEKETTPDEVDAEDAADGKSGRISRRSSRTKKSRLPAPASAAQAQPQTSKIAIRRVDGTEHVILKKSNTQEIATLTRANTRKNKQGAFNVTVRLLKLTLDAASLPPIDDATKELVVGKNIRWDEQLTYYQENPETLADAESLATPDELSMPDATATPVAKPKAKISKTSTPKIRRVRGLGSTNGTPGKGLLAPAELLPDGVMEKDIGNMSTQQLPRPKVGKSKKMTVASISTELAPSTTPSNIKLATLDITPVGVEPTKERKSRLAAPKKVVLPQVVIPAPAEGKENAQRTGISAATPKKGIPAPKVIIPPSVGMESGLPRRRGRKY
jgi:hypothetical protein